jgi:Protein of unknown function (DUF2934)
MKPLFAESRRPRTTSRVVIPMAAENQAPATPDPASARTLAKEPNASPSSEPLGLKHITLKDTCDRTRLPTHQEIEKLAYNLYLARDKKPGHHLEDWLAAEQQLRHLAAAE